MNRWKSFKVNGASVSAVRDHRGWFYEVRTKADPTPHPVKMAGGDDGVVFFGSSIARGWTQTLRQVRQYAENIAKED